MPMLAIAISKYIKVKINIGSKIEMLEINAWSRIKASSFKHQVLDARKNNSRPFFKEI